uniref:Uncharacterized protein n=1 Tax=Brassica campestris TaxID=3711 RepID=M4DDH7_BRACM
MGYKIAKSTGKALMSLFYNDLIPDLGQSNLLFRLIKKLGTQQAGISNWSPASSHRRTVCSVHSRSNSSEKKTKRDNTCHWFSRMGHYTSRSCLKSVEWPIRLVYHNAYMMPDEISGINNVFAEPGMLAPTGLFISGIKYMVIQGETNAVIRGKKCHFLLYIVGSWWCYNKEDHPSLGLFYDKPMTPGQYNMVVERHDDYLTESGL